MSEPCEICASEICERTYPLSGTICNPCTTATTYNQEQDQDEDQDEDQGSRPTSVVPGPGCNEDGPELRRLEDAHRAGKLQSVEVQLGPMPAHAGLVMREIAEDMQLRMGLRRAVGDDRPLPYAVSEAVRAGIAKDKPTASRAIAALVRAGVIDHVGKLPALKPGLDGTKLYAPPLPAVRALPSAERRTA